MEENENKTPEELAEAKLTVIKAAYPKAFDVKDVNGKITVIHFDGKPTAEELNTLGIDFPNCKIIGHTGRASAEQIADWKKEYQDRVSEIEVLISETEISHCYCRKPNRIHLAKGMSLITNNEPLEAGECILDNTWLGGDPRCKSIEDKDTEFRVGVAWELYSKVRVHSATLKNA